MKKLGMIFIITLVITVSMYALSRDGRTQNAMGKKILKASATQQDKSQKPKSAVLQNRLVEADIDRGKILFTADANASLRVLHRSIHEYYEDDEVDAIVEGDISNIQYTHIGTSIFTVLSLNVSQTFKGQTENPILVYEDGGYAKFKDMLSVFEGHVDVDKLTTDQIENGIVEEKMFGAPHSEVGQRVVLFLIKNPNLGSSPTRTYQVVSSVYGKLTLDRGRSVFKRFQLDETDDPADKSALPAQGVVPFETSITRADLVSRLTNTN